MYKKMANKFYIKERHNPQIEVYYVAKGQLTKKDAKKEEGSLYGFNIMKFYDTKEEYENAIEKLKSVGARVQ